MRIEIQAKITTQIDEDFARVEYATVTFDEAAILVLADAIRQLESHAPSPEAD